MLTPLRILARWSKIYLQISLILYFITISEAVQTGTHQSINHQNEYHIKQKRFIRELYNQQKYYDCIAETRRLLSNWSSIGNRNEFHYFIEMNYFLGKQYKSVISHLKSKDQIQKKRFPNLLLLSQAYHNIGQSNESLNVLEKIDYSSVREKDKYQLFYRKSELLLESSRYEDLLYEIESNNFLKYDPHVEKLRIDTLKYKNLSKKSKWFSVSLSAVIPGSGQIYSDRFWDGIISFIAIVGTSYGAYHFYNTGDKSLSIAFSIFASLSYAGNLYGAYNSSKRKNIELDRSFKSVLIENHIPEYNPKEYIDIDSFIP